MQRLGHGTQVGPGRHDVGAGLADAVMYEFAGSCPQFLARSDEVGGRAGLAGWFMTPKGPRFHTKRSSVPKSSHSTSRPQAERGTVMGETGQACRSSAAQCVADFVSSAALPRPGPAIVAPQGRIAALHAESRVGSRPHSGCPFAARPPTTFPHSVLTPVRFVPVRNALGFRAHSHRSHGRREPLRNSGCVWHAGCVGSHNWVSRTAGSPH